MKNKEENPMFTKKGAWLWLVCAPAALIIAGVLEGNIEHRKWLKKRHERAVRNWDWWWS